jgi:hypothetical protein
VDGILARLSALIVAALGSILRIFQNGVVHMYAAAMVVGVAVFGWFFVAPHADATVVETDGDYVVKAGPGMGYTYRWDADGNGQPDSEGFGAQAEVKVHLDPDQTKTVRLEVSNAFGLKGKRDIHLARPKAKLEVGQN